MLFGTYVGIFMANIQLALVSNCTYSVLLFKYLKDCTLALFNFNLIRHDNPKLFSIPNDNV